jgi:hypothetical protein
MDSVRIKGISAIIIGVTGKKLYVFIGVAQVEKPYGEIRFFSEKPRGGSPGLNLRADHSEGLHLQDRLDLRALTGLQGASLDDKGIRARLAFCRPRGLD